MTEERSPSKGEKDYGLSLRAAARGLWRGILSFDQFVELMVVTVRRGLTRAWNEGAKECGINPEDMTAEERLELERAIFENYDRIFSYAEFIEQNSRANGGKLGRVLWRTELWLNRYDSVRVKAAALACKDKKKQWHLGATEKHCRTCLKFEGRTYRYSVWEKNNALPKSRVLCCGGFRCDCTLEDTETRVTPGPFPRAALCE